jgi:TRAP-type C4-dicarboxylate transport system permease small subunit
MMSQTDVAATAARQATGDEPVPPQAEIAAKHPAMRAVEAFAEALIVLALLGELLLVLANVFARVYLQRSFLWSDEVARLSLSILAFIGGAVAYRRRDHAFVRVVGLVGFASLQFIASSWGERTPVLQLPAALIALPLPLGMALLALFALDNLVRHSRRTAWTVGVAFVAVVAALTATRTHWLLYLGGEADPLSSSRRRW